MADLAEMFEYYIADLFDGTAEFKDAGNSVVTIVYPVKQIVDDRRYSRTIAVIFEKSVVKEFQAAFDDNNEPRKDRIGDAVCETVAKKLAEYDENGPRESPFKIYIGDAEAGL